MVRKLDDHRDLVDTILRRLPGVTSISSNLSLKEMKAASGLPVTPSGSA